MAVNLGVSISREQEEMHWPGSHVVISLLCEGHLSNSKDSYFHKAQSV